ncbi:MAG: hypothetical protein NVSMB57_03540 [Actinomycetota bacterium]
MMLIAVLGIPAALGAVLWALSGLESRVVAPYERGTTITKMLERVSSPEEIEAEVARTLAPLLAPRRRRVFD